MNTRRHIASEKKRTGQCNCAQSVLCTYCDITGLDEKTSLSIASGFAAGMGSMEGTCGAIVGAGMVLGMVHGGRAVADMRQLLAKFQQRNGAIQCRQLKGRDTGIVLRECHQCVADAWEFLEEIIAENDNYKNI